MGCNHSKFATAAVVVSVVDQSSTIPPAIDIQPSKPPITTNETRFITSATNTIVVDHDHVNLESHQLVWLDAKTSEQNSVNTVTIESLRKIVDYTKLFDNAEACQQYLQSSKDHNNTFLVTSGELGEKLIPEVYCLQHVLVIYVYCQDKEYHQQWASKYPKVKELRVGIAPISLILCLCTGQESSYDT